VQAVRAVGTAPDAGARDEALAGLTADLAQAREALAA
jgi:hypothetical protein